MDFKELQDLIRILEESGLSEIEIEEDGRRIRLQKNPTFPPQAFAAMTPAQAAALSSSGEPVASEDPEELDETAGMPTIDAPMVGTFYLAPAPGEEPFVKVGDQVEENQTLCIVEAMKLMNEIAAKFTGIIEKILVENGQPVEFGQPLFAIRAIE